MHIHSTTHRYVADLLARPSVKALLAKYGREYPAKIPSTVPPERVLVHNNVRPARRQGTRGFRFWLQAPNERIERCPCAWASELPEHYRVVREEQP